MYYHTFHFSVNTQFEKYTTQALFLIQQTVDVGHVGRIQHHLLILASVRKQTSGVVIEMTGIRERVSVRIGHGGARA